jgi:hypothetical protein
MEIFIYICSMITNLPSYDEARRAAREGKDSTAFLHLAIIYSKGLGVTPNRTLANYFFENFGIEVDVDPYGENSAIELGENGLVPLSNCKHPELTQDGVFADLVQGGFWDEVTGNLEEGYISVEDLNEVIKSDGDDIGNGIREVQLKQDGKVARLLLTFK